MRRLSRGRGFSLIELVISLGILGILMSLALPSFKVWMDNIRLRNQADSLLSGLQLARSEALKRNRFVRFQLMSSTATGGLDNTCELAASGTNRWIVSHGDPTEHCGDAQSQALPGDNAIYSTTPVLLMRGLQDARQDGITTALDLFNARTAASFSIPTGETGHALCFAPGGTLTRYESTTRLCTASVNPGTTVVVRASLNITRPSEQCAPIGDARCLRITVSSSGEIKLCDPAVSAPDPRTCPW